MALVALAAWLFAPAPWRDRQAGLERRLAAARPLTSDPALEVAPRFSADGARVAYALGEGNESRIVVQALDGSARQVIGQTGVLSHSPVFFPDGLRIAYWRRAGEECAIIEHDLGSKAERRLLDCALAPRARFDISADGRRLAFTGKARPQYPAGLWILDLERGTPRALTAPAPGMGDDVFPRFSPDGRRVAFFRGNESQRQPWIVASDDPASAKAAAKLTGLSYGLAWLGGEGPLLVAADWLDFRALHVLDLATGHARLAGGRGARFPDVSTGGDIVYENAVYAANAWLVEVERAAGSPRAMWRSALYTNQPEFSPDGRRVAFASNREGTDAIYVAALEGAPRKIASGEGLRYMRPHWSADGRSVLAVRIARDTHGAAVQQGVRIPADGGPEEALRALGDAVGDVRETRDGRWLLWGEAAGHAMRLMRAPLGRPGEAEHLPLPLVSQYHVNSERIVLAQPQLERLTSCGLEDFICEPLEVTVADSELYHWTLAERSIYLRVREGASSRLARFDLATRSVAATLPFGPSGAGTSVAASPDEMLLIVVREEAPQIDLMIARR